MVSSYKETENNEQEQERRWYCGRKLSAAFDEYIKTMQNCVALVDTAEKRIVEILKAKE